MTFHIGAKPGEIAETVLLPGAPYRARWAAHAFLENPVLVNEVRGNSATARFASRWRPQNCIPSPPATSAALLRF
jgi:purine-nucleoside phosphorylase